MVFDFQVPVLGTYVLKPQPTLPTGESSVIWFVLCCNKIIVFLHNTLCYSIITDLGGRYTHIEGQYLSMRQSRLKHCLSRSFSARTRRTRCSDRTPQSHA